MSSLRLWHSDSSLTHLVRHAGVSGMPGGGMRHREASGGPDHGTQLDPPAVSPSRVLLRTSPGTHGPWGAHSGKHTAPWRVSGIQQSQHAPPAGDSPSSWVPFPVGDSHTASPSPEGPLRGTGLSSWAPGSPSGSDRLEIKYCAPTHAVPFASRALN